MRAISSDSLVVGASKAVVGDYLYPDEQRCKTRRDT